MADCFKECINTHLPQLGWMTVGLIVVGLLALVASGVGITIAAIGAVIGVAVGSVVLTRLLACLTYCIGKAAGL